MADLKISELAALAGANLAAGDLLPVVDLSASETKKITVTDLVGNAVTLIADATIPGAKVLFSAGTIAGGSIATGGINTTQLADDAVTAAKLGNESTVDLVTTLPGSGAYTGQLALDTDDLKIYCWDGSAWQSIKAAGSINTVVGDTAGIVNLTVTTSGDQVTITTSLDNTAAAAQFLAGPAANAGAVVYRTITGADLPAATTTAKGAAIVNGEGLRMDGDQIEIDNDLSASATHGVVTYNAKGLVTGGRAIASGDLPAATAGSKGAVTPGTGLGVDGSGNLNHTNTVTPGTYTKVTVDGQGHVSTGGPIEAADLPNHSAALLTTGTLDVARLGANTVTGVKLANSSTAQFGSTQPVAEYTGQLYFNSLSRDIYIWDGNVWQPIGISVGEIVFAGTYDANTNLVSSVTSDGTALGFVVGQALPAAAATNNRYYLVVAEAGTGVAPAPTVALSPPDIILSNGSAWTEIDVSQTVTAQVASNVSFTPYGNIGSTNVQAALEELDNEKLGGSGGTVNGELLIGTTGSLVFEGATANAFETTLAVTDPTADRTITLPNVTGTVVTTGDTGSVTGTMMADATVTHGKIANITAGSVLMGNASNIPTATALTGDITLSSAGVTAIASGAVVDGDINASAAISYSKLASLTAGNILLGNASNVPTSTAITGDITINSSGVTAIGSGVIVDADINASAAIADTKLATISTAGKVSGGAITSGTIGGSTAFNTSGNVATTSTLAVGQSSAAANTDLDLAGTYAQTVVAVSALAIDCSTGNYFTKTINGASTFTVSNVPASRAYAFTLELTHTSGTVTWFSGVEWPAGTAPTLTTGKTHLFMFVTDDGGTRWRASSLINYTN